MPEIDRYTLEALESRTNFAQRIKNYSRDNKSYGLTHIKYEIAASVTAYVISPFAGIIAEVIDNYKHAYFDTDTGELLGTTQNEAAIAANRKGINFINQGRFSEAKRAFNTAYQVCASGYSEEKSYRNSSDAAEIAMEAQSLMDKKEYEAAAKKFQEAYNHSNVSDVYRRFSNCRDQANQRVAEEAERERLGKLAEERKRAEEEEKKRQQKLAEEKRRAEEEAKRQKQLAEEKAKNEMADNLDKQGHEFWKQGKYNEAHEAFKNAYNTCVSKYKDQERFRNNMKIAEQKLANLAEERRKANEEEKRQKILAEQQQQQRKSKNAQRWQHLTQKVITRRQQQRKQLADEWRAVVKQVLIRSAQAQKLFEKGTRLWEEAWLAEEEDESQEAAEKFLAALEAFEQCTTYMKEATASEKYSDLVRLKIQGNEHFNRGIELQDQGNELTDSEAIIAKYSEGQHSFEEAIKNFNAGLAKGDQRFGACKATVQESIKELQGGIQAVKNKQMALALSQLNLGSSGMHNLAEIDDRTMGEDRRRTDRYGEMFLHA